MLQLYKAYDETLARLVLILLKTPALVFHENSYVHLLGVCKGAEITYQGVRSYRLFRTSRIALWVLKDRRITRVMEKIREGDGMVLSKVFFKFLKMEVVFWKIIIRMCLSR